MGDLFRSGQTVQSTTGQQQCTIVRFLGGGGQGEVYKAKLGALEVALKWYYPESATSEQMSALKELVDQGKPSDRFLWPEDLFHSSEVPGFGYVMGLRPAAYKGLVDLVNGKITPTFRAKITAAFGLVKAFRSLHNKGLCYRDISFGNAFFEPDSGDVLVCDNDNVGAGSSPAGVLGTPDFMAPEVVRGEAKPSINTDLHSLAVLLFYMLFVSHPLSGRRILSIRSWDLPAREWLYGRDPVFIFDPANKVNEAVSSAEDPYCEAGGNAIPYWQLYPKFLRDIFTKAFTVGLKDPGRRVTELEWLGALARLLNSIFRCGCGQPNFYDTDVVTDNGSQPRKCWKCGTVLKLPFRIRIGSEVVMLNSDTKLYGHHLVKDFDLTKSVAEVVRHPTDPNVWGLKNLSPGKWVAEIPGVGVRDIEVGRSVPLAAQTKVAFGPAEGEILY